MYTLRSGFKHRLTRAAVTLVALGGAALPVAPAHAGTAHVYQCKLPNGFSAPFSGWTAFGSPATYNEGCKSANGQQVDFMLVGSDSAVAGSRSGWRLDAPADTTIAQATFERRYLLNRDSHVVRPTDWAGWLSVNQPGIENAIDSCASGCSGKGFALAPAGQQDPIFTTGPLENAIRLYAMAGCVGPAGSGCPDGGHASTAVKAVDLELRDDFAPTASGLAGALGSSGGHQGTEQLTFDAADRGMGLRHLIVELKAPGAAQFAQLSKNLVDSNGGSCAELDYLLDSDREYASMVPCKLSAPGQTVSLNTTSYSDGDYGFRVRLEDASGNSGTVVDKQLKIDNIPPPANTVLPVVTGTPRNGQTLSSSVGTWNGAGISYSRQWQRCNGGTCADVPGATEATYNVTSADVDRTIRVVVTATNVEGSTSANSAQVGPVLPPPGNTALPTIAGKANNGQVLTADKGTWTGADNAYTYQWQRCSTSATPVCSAIDGATAATYTVTSADVAHTIRVIVTATNLEGVGSAISAQTTAIAPPPANTAIPTITGTPRNGQTLTVQPGTWTGTNVSHAYQWQRCTTDETPLCEPITGATQTTYRVAAGDANKKLRVVVTGASLDGSSSATSDFTTAINPAPANNTKPKVTGVAKVNEKLEAERGSWTGSGLAYGYQWQRCATKADAATCVAIDGGTNGTYTLAQDDEGSFIRVVVTAANVDGSTSVPSEMTNAVQPEDQSCSSCNPEPAPDPLPGPDPGANNGTGGDLSSARFTSESRKTVRSRYGAKKTVGGRLVDAAGVPIAGARVEITDGKTAATVITDGQGSYAYTLLKGVSRQVTFAYRSKFGATVYNDTAIVTVKVAGVLKLKAKKKVVPAKGKMQLLGRLMGAGKGAQIQVQARDGRKWRTIDVVKTDKKGKVKYAYKFKRVTGATFLFRLTMTAQPKVKLDAATSRPVKVKVS